MKFTQSCSEGIVHVKHDNNEYTLKSGQIDLGDSNVKYYSENTSATYIIGLNGNEDDNTSTKAVKISLGLPDEGAGESYVLTKDTEEPSGWTWTNTKDLALTNYVSIDIDNYNGTNYQYQQFVIEPPSNSGIDFSSGNYVFTALVDLNIYYSNVVETLQELDENNKHAFIVITSTPVDVIQNADIDIKKKWNSFSKWTEDVTATTTNVYHMSKVIPDIRFESNDGKLYLNLVKGKVSDMHLNVQSNEEHGVSFEEAWPSTQFDVRIIGTVTLLQYRKNTSSEAV